MTPLQIYSTLLKIGKVKFGLFILLMSTVALGLAFYKAQNKSYSMALFLILLAGLLLRIYTASDLYLHEWDERYHALVAKHMIEAPFRPTLYAHPILDYDYRSWVSNHIWLHKPPLPLWLMAFSLQVFGINEWALRLPSILASTLAIALTYEIGKYYLDQKSALLAAFLHAIHGLVIELTGGRIATDHYDVLFLVFIELGIYFSIRYTRNAAHLKWAIGIGMSMGLAILIKWLPALIILPIWMLLAISSKPDWSRLIRDGSLIILTAFFLVFPWQWYIFHEFRLEANWESSYNILHITQGIEGHLEPWYYHLNKWRLIFGELIYLPLVWLLWKTVKSYTHRAKPKLLSLSVWIFIPLVFFSVVKTKMQAYTLFVAPAIFILSALFFRLLRLSRPSHSKRIRRLVTIISILLIVLPIRYSLERLKPFEDRDRNPSWVQHLKSLKSVLPSNAILFNTAHPIECMFYTNILAAYSSHPDDKTIEKLLHLGYRIFLLEGEQLRELVLE